MSDRPEDVDAAFAAIVADLEREGLGSDLSKIDEPENRKRGSTAEASDSPEPAPPTTSPSASPPASPPAQQSNWRRHEGEWDWSWGTEEDHYVPPEPPPLPRLRPLTVVALVLIIAALVLLVLPGVIGLDARIGTPIALVALTFGGALLLLRIRQNPKAPDDGRDDGAQL